MSSDLEAVATARAVYFGQVGRVFSEGGDREEIRLCPSDKDLKLTGWRISAQADLEPWIVV